MTTLFAIRMIATLMVAALWMLSPAGWEIRLSSWVEAHWLKFRYGR